MNAHDDAGSASTGGEMLRWALVFLILGIVTAIFGFGVMTGAAAGLAEILCYGFFALAVITLVSNFSNRTSP